MTPELRTKRLLLRAFALEDAGEVQRLAGHPAVSKLTSNVPYPYLDGEAEKWISTHAENAKIGKGFVWALCSGPELSVVGAISLLDMVGGHKAEIGYWLGHEYWGQGLMVEAGHVVVAYGFLALDLRRIGASTYRANIGSRRVLEELGFKYEGCKRCNLLKDGKFHDQMFWGLLQEEWNEKR